HSRLLRESTPLASDDATLRHVDRNFCSCVDQARNVVTTQLQVTGGVCGLVARMGNLLEHFNVPSGSRHPSADSAA
ncbi:MAG: hypothetical protein GX593_14910, partial [Actinomycetales bacterium]|nr:hypothetical protein [Actinomycetales bacterium]